MRIGCFSLSFMIAKEDYFIFGECFKVLWHFWLSYLSIIGESNPYATGLVTEMQQQAVYVTEEIYRCEILTVYKSAQLVYFTCCCITTSSNNKVCLSLESSDKSQSDSSKQNQRITVEKLDCETKHASVCGDTRGPHWAGVVQTVHTMTSDFK